MLIDKASIKLIISIQPCKLIHRSNDLLFLPMLYQGILLIRFRNSRTHPFYPLVFLSLSLSSFDISHNFTFIDSRLKTKLIDEKFFHYSFFFFFFLCVYSCMNVLFVRQTGYKNITLHGFVVIFDSRCVLDLIKLQKD